MLVLTSIIISSTILTEYLVSTVNGTMSLKGLILKEVRLLSTRFHVLASISSFALSSGPSEVLSIRESHNLRDSNSQKVMDIQEKDKIKAKKDKTEYENGKNVKEKSKLKPSQKVKVNKVKSKSTPGSGFGKSNENRTRKPKLPKVGQPCMRTRSQSRNSNRQQQQVNPTFVEPFNLVEPIENQAPLVVTMDDTRTMAQLLEAPTVGYEDAIVVPEITTDNFEL
ncbi:hypothetical protein Tco_0294355 [Tanacetum coccineum]